MPDEVIYESDLMSDLEYEIWLEDIDNLRKITDSDKDKEAEELK